jgi:uncharacterized membrane protein
VTHHLFGIASKRAAYGALIILTLIWGLNWMAMKFGLQFAHPVIYNIERTFVAIALVFAVLFRERRPLKPESWMAVIVTGFFQTTINFGATTMALAGGGAGRTAVLVFTMPFWTMLIAWPVLHERVRGSQWLAVGLALAGLVLVVEPWHWQGELAPKLWATLSGFGWAAGTVATKYFQRHQRLDMLNLIAWQMVTGIIPICLIPLVWPLAGGAVERHLRVRLAVRGRDRHRHRLHPVDRDPRVAPRRHGVAQHVRDSRDRARFVDAHLRRAPECSRVGGHRFDRRRPRDRFGARMARQPARRARGRRSAGDRGRLTPRPNEFGPTSLALHCAFFVGANSFARGSISRHGRMDSALQDIIRSP